MKDNKKRGVKSNKSKDCVVAPSKCKKEKCGDKKHHDHHHKKHHHHHHHESSSSSSEKRDRHQDKEICELKKADYDQEKEICCLKKTDAVLECKIDELSKKLFCDCDNDVSCDIVGNVDCVEWDFIIVGYGTAGGPLARFLSDPLGGNYYNKKVLMIEYGENRTTDPVVLDPYGLYTTSLTNDPKYAFAYPIIQNLPQTLNYSDGRTWGGSSAHNNMQAVRGAPNTWDEIGTLSANTKWNYANVLPYMKFMENYHPTGTASNLTERGNAGLLDITQNPSSSASLFLQQYAVTTGATLVDDYNDPSSGILVTSANQQYVTPEPASHRTGAYSFLPTSVLTESGFGVGGRKLRVLSNAIVSRVLFRGTTAIGVEYVIYDGTNSSVHKVYSKSKVILCAGAVGSPAILQRSGVGNSTLLNELDIPVVVNNPNVGSNLQNHYGPLAVAENNNIMIDPFIFTQSFINLAPYLSDIQLRRYQVLYVEGTGGIFFNANFPGILAAGGVDPLDSSAGFFGINMNPQSLGSIEIVSTNAAILPRFTHNLFTDGDETDVGSDANMAVAYYKLLKDVATAYGVVMLYPFPAQYGSDAQLLQAAKDAIVIAFNAAGTCRMAPTIATGVVDGDMNVFGTENLMVVDCSVFPIINSGTTAYPCYVAGILAAKYLGAPGLP